MVCVTTARYGDAAVDPAVQSVPELGRRRLPPRRCDRGGVHAFLGNFGIGSATMAPASVPDTSLLAATSGEEQLVGAAVPGRRETGVGHGAEAYGCRCGAADADHRTRCGGDRFS
jgi:hypothetical protein